MMQPCVTISLIPEARGGPFVFWDDLAAACEKAAALGFNAVEIFARSAEAIDLDALQKLLERHHLKVAALGSGGGWIIHKWHLCHANPEVRQQARQFIRSIIDAAGKLGASAIVGSMQGRFEAEVTREQAVAWLREALEELGEYASRYRRPLLYEPLNRYETNLFNRAVDTVGFVQSLQSKNVKILADLFHMNIEEASLPDAIRTYGPALGHLHFVDSNRRAAGFGHIDYRPIVEALRQIDYGGYISAEALPLPDSTASATQTIAAYQKFFGAP